MLAFALAWSTEVFIDILKIKKYKKRRRTGRSKGFAGYRADTMQRDQPGE